MTYEMFEIHYNSAILFEAKQRGYSPEVMKELEQIHPCYWDTEIEAKKSTKDALTRWYENRMRSAK